MANPAHSHGSGTGVPERSGEALPSLSPDLRRPKVRAPEISLHLLSLAIVSPFMRQTPSLIAASALDAIRRLLLGIESEPRYFRQRAAKRAT